MLIQEQARLLLALLLLVGCGLQAAAHPPQANSSIDTFWARFRIAVINGDQGGLARMTQFPVAMPYGLPVVRTRSQLLARYKQIFDGEANAAKCFTSAKPQKDP